MLEFQNLFCWLKHRPCTLRCCAFVLLCVIVSFANLDIKIIRLDYFAEKVSLVVHKKNNILFKNMYVISFTKLSK